MDISGLNKAAVLAALYNRSMQRGMGFMHTRGTHPMTEQQAQLELDANPTKYFDYLHGLVIHLIEALAKVLEERITNLPERVFKMIPQEQCLRKIAEMGRDCRKAGYNPDKGQFAMELLHLWSHLDDLDDMSQRDWELTRVKLVWRAGCDLAILSLTASPSPQIVEWMQSSGSNTFLQLQFHEKMANFGADLAMLKMYETHPEAFTDRDYGDAAKDRWFERWKDSHRKLTVEILS